MLETLVTFVFYIITSVYSLLFAPFINIIFSLFPAITTYFDHCLNFLLMCLVYFKTCMNLILLPTGAFILLLDYFSIKYSIYLVKLSIKLGVKIYHIFKP